MPWTIEFPDDIGLEGFDPNPRKGRNPLEGTLRACGVEAGNVSTLCADDPDFMEAFQLAKGRTIVTTRKLCNLYMLLRFYLPKLARGNIVEFGCYKGGSAIFMASLAKRFLGGATVYGFDTFQGMPPTDRSIDSHRAGDFAKVDLPELRAYAAEKGLHNLQFIEGRFEDTAPAALAAAGPVALVHIDCDIYSAVAFAYEVSKPQMVRGGYIVLDDSLTPTCLGATEAMEELMIRRDGLHAEQMMPHPVFRYPPI